MTECRVVIDTGVIISALLSKTTVPRRLLDTALRNHVALFSESTLEELGSRLLRPKSDRYVSLAERIEFLDVLPTFGELIEVTSRLDVCRDPNDNRFLELAVDGEAELLVSGDRDLLVLHPFRGVDILTPRGALDRLV